MAAISGSRPAVQRFLNRSSGKMETRGAMKAYHQQTLAGRHGQAQGGGGRSQGQQQGPSFIQETPGQILARARQIVNSEVQAETLPFRQAAARLPGEERGVQAAHTANYGQLDTGTAALQAGQGASALTYQNAAAQALKKAEETKVEGEAGSRERSQSESNRNLLIALAQSGVQGTATRQKAESDYLTNLKGTGAQEAVAGTEAIRSEYGKRLAKNTEEEAQVRSTKPGRVGRLFGNERAEQEKLRLAAGGLQVKEATAENTIKSGAATRAHTRKADALAAKKNTADEAYKKASAPVKALKDKLDIKAKEVAIKKALEGNPHKGSLTSDKVAEVSGQAAKTFNFYKAALQEGADPAEVRQQLEAGQARRGYEVKNKKSGKKETKYYTEHFTAVTQPVVITMAEEIYNKGYVGAQTKQELRELGLKDSGWSDHFYGGPRSATHGVTGGVKAGRKKK